MPDILDTAYLDGLSRVDIARRDADQLRLTGPATQLDFTLVQPTPDAEPVGTRWRLESLITGDAVSSVLGEATLLLVTLLRNQGRPEDAWAVGRETKYDEVLSRHEAVWFENHVERYTAHVDMFVVGRGDRCRPCVRFV